MSQEKQLPEGFRYGDQLPPEGRRGQRPPPQPRRRRAQSLEDIELSRVYTLREAIKRFRSRKHGVHKVTDVNFEGARIGAIFIEEALGEQYFVMFKRDFYKRFSDHFPKVPKKGYGVLTAKKIVSWAADEGVNIAAVFPSGRCYVIDAMDFWLFYEEYQTDCPHIEGEIAAPLEMFKRLF